MLTPVCVSLALMKPYNSQRIPAPLNKDPPQDVSLPSASPVSYKRPVPDASRNTQRRSYHTPPTITHHMLQHKHPALQPIQTATLRVHPSTHVDLINKHTLPPLHTIFPSPRYQELTIRHLKSKSSPIRRSAPTTNLIKRALTRRPSPPPTPSSTSSTLRRITLAALF